MKIAGAAAAGFAIGFIFGSAESNLKKITPFVVDKLSGFMTNVGIPKGTAINLSEKIWVNSLSLALGTTAAALGFLVGLRIMGPIGGLVGAGAALVGYMVGRELFAGK